METAHLMEIPSKTLLMFFISFPSAFSIICLLTLLLLENPYTTADNWLLKENLPLSYREQVVQFILQNSGQSGSDFSLDTSFHDPYTGCK